MLLYIFLFHKFSYTSGLHFYFSFPITERKVLKLSLVLLPTFSDFYRSAIFLMECSIPQAFTNKAATSDVKNLQPGQSPPKAMLHVNFNLENDEVHERKKKYLTAKYGQHQMNLIKKRLRVEMWMFDQLQVLYDSSDESGNYEVEIDLDELLDIEAEAARREWLRNKLIGVKQSKEAVEKFITELLQRAGTL